MMLIAAITLVGLVAGSTGAVIFLWLRPGRAQQLLIGTMDWHLRGLSAINGTGEDLCMLEDIIADASLFLLGPGRYGFTLPQRRLIRQLLATFPKRGEAS